MGIVINQSIKNTIITYFGFGIGAINALFLYTIFLGKLHYGIVVFVISAANIMTPLISFGVQNTLIRFYSKYNSESERDNFLSLMLLLPLIVILPTIVLLYFFYPQITFFILNENPNVAPFLWLIPLIGIFMGYFEIFYAWVKVHLQSVFGNFIKEIGLRILISIFLLGVYFNVISVTQFITATMFVYLTSTLIMFYYAHKVQAITFHFKVPKNAKAILVYSSFIILSGSVANMLLDIDKTMLNQYVKIENIAYYSVAIFIATVIAVPSRAMHQITYPITAKLMSENNYVELNELYKKTSITLQIVGGLVFVGILVNINQLYTLLPKNYSDGILVVFLIGLSKYFDLILGNNNALIFNSKYYKTVLFLGLFLAFFAITLNILFIPKFGINGAAIATLLSITLYSLAKLLFVVLKMKLYPFTIKTIYALGIGLLCFFGFYFWEFSFHPILNIGLKSILVSVVYIGLSYSTKLSSEFNNVIDVVINKISSRF